MTDFRTLCFELVEKIDYTWGDIPEDVLDLLRRARAALAQPEPPSLKELAQQSLLRLANCSNNLMAEDAADMETIRRALEQLPE